MNAEWIKSPTTRRVLVHWADVRPAWLWSEDGKSLLWRNGAARFFNGKLKKHGLKLAPDPVPIKGQVARLVRLGSLGRSSLSRIQFLAGEKPVSATCTVTPLAMPGGNTALLVVGVDAIEPQVLAATSDQPLDPLTQTLFPQDAQYLLVQGGKLAGGSRRALDRLGPAIAQGGIPSLAEAEGEAVDLAGTAMILTRLRAGPDDASLLLLEASQMEPADRRIEDVRAEEGLAALEERAPAHGESITPDGGAVAEPMLPIELPPLARTTREAEPQPGIGVEEEEYWAEPIEPPAVGAGRALSSLFDRLADHDELYAPLPDKDAGPREEGAGRSPAAVEGTSNEQAGQTGTPAAPAELDDIAAIIEFADDVEEPAAEATAQGATYRVTGRGFTPGQGPEQAKATQDIQAETGQERHPGEPAPDSEVVERVSRYNFDELSRILSDRVGAEPAPSVEPPVHRPIARTTDRALVNVAAETFILNRLPLGIMVFRDQQVLFANRALTDLTGYETIDALRAAGLAAIFPSEEAAIAGPVTHLVDRGGTLLPVTARLQSISWQGRPALMLSAGLADSRTGHEGAVKTFAEALAELREEGFIAADRAGIVTRISPRGQALLGAMEADVVGKPLRALIDAKDGPALKGFLERPARFAETARPSLAAHSLIAGTDLLILAEGQAGIVSGYFGFLRGVPAPARSGTADEAADPSMLARMSRGIRRPLNTIIGFSDLIRSAAFGSIENQRYLEYARDIRTAGQEISTLVDELDEFSRLQEGRHAARPGDLDLGALLETCVVRVRAQAGAARVLVRSSISERLPRIRADLATMRQAVLNLLASAIDQTPSGGTVVLSAQFEDDGSILVNVRDGGGRNPDPGERFVVFRDGAGRDGEIQGPVRSSVGLALTRSLLAVNACALSVDSGLGVGTLFSLSVPAEVVAG